MQDIDSAKKAFDQVRAFANCHKEVIFSGSEADARLRLIDRILIEVLGWQRDGIRAEPPTESGYIDYLLSSGGRSVFVVEAKKAGNTLVSTKVPNFAFYKVGGPALRDSEDGLTQAARYCSEKSVAFAALTNGSSWVGFRPLRIDGVPYREGRAAVFPNLEAVASRFAEFYDLFSQGWRSLSHLQHLSRPGGRQRPQSHRSPRYRHPSLKHTPDEKNRASS